MKIKFTSGLIVNVVIGLALALLFLSWAVALFWSTGSSEGTASSVTMVNALKPLTEPIPDSIPYYLHKRMQDSITQLRTLKNGDGPNAGTAAYLSLWGTQVSNYCDTCTINYHKWSFPSAFPINDKPKQNYLLLEGWKLKPAPLGFDSVKFHVEHGQAYLRKLIIDSAHKNGITKNIAHMYDIPVRFSYDREHSCIKIPIELSTKIWLDRIFITISISTVIYFMFFIFGGFIKFLIDVSRGQTFTLKNIRRLKIIGISLIAIEALTLLINFCMPLIFHRYFTADVVLNEKSWADSWKILIAGIAFLLLYKAFKSGKKNKDEQDLVI